MLSLITYNYGKKTCFSDTTTASPPAVTPNDTRTGKAIKSNKNLYEYIGRFQLNQHPKLLVENHLIEIRCETSTPLVKVSCENPAIFNKSRKFRFSAEPVCENNGEVRAIELMEASNARN